MKISDDGKRGRNVNYPFSNKAIHKKKKSGRKRQACSDGLFFFAALDPPSFFFSFFHFLPFAFLPFALVAWTWGAWNPFFKCDFFVLHYPRGYQRLYFLRQKKKKLSFAFPFLYFVLFFVKKKFSFVLPFHFILFLLINYKKWKIQLNWPISIGYLSD